LQLNENIATLSWIADQAPQSGLAPAAGTNERYQLLNKLSIVATEIHKAYGPFFAGPSDEAKVPLYENLRVCESLWGFLCPVFLSFFLLALLRLWMRGVTPVRHFFSS
jgi:hypothetical protein